MTLVLASFIPFRFHHFYTVLPIQFERKVPFAPEQIAACRGFCVHPRRYVRFRV